MQVLVLGGTSFFGLEIVRQLVAAGHEVAIFTRGQTPLPSDLQGRVTGLTGDRTDVASLTRAAEAGRWDAVIDNIAFTADEVRDAVRLFRQAGRYLFTSSAAVYRWSPPGSLAPMHEESVNFEADPAEYQPGDRGWDYAYGKVYGEKVLLTEAEVPWTVIRPPIVLGPNDPTLRGHWYFARLFEGGPLLMGDGGTASFRLAYSVDLARSYLLALEHEGAAGRIYNIAQPEIVTLRRLLELAIASVETEHHSELVPIPSALLKSGPHHLGGPYGSMVNFILDVSRAQQELGYTGTPFATWLPETVRWYQHEFQGETAPLLETRLAERRLAERWRQHMEALEDQG